MSQRNPPVLHFHAIADPHNPDNVIKPNADGSVNVRVIQVGPEVTSVVDKSFDPDGSSHIVIAANEDRVGFYIECPVDATLNPSGYSLFINIDAPATANGDSYEVTPGGSFPPLGMPLVLGDIYAIGSATIVKAPAKEFV